MSNASTPPSKNPVDFSRVEDIYGHWAAQAVETFNTKGDVKPCLLSVNFLPDGGFGCTVIDTAYVSQMVGTKEGQVELRRFTLGLLDDDAMRSDMVAKGFKPADAVVFISEIELRPTNGVVASNTEGILVVVHTPGAIYRGISPILNAPKRHAKVGAISMDTTPHRVTSALSPLVSPVVAEVLATRHSHDIHRTPGQTQ